MPRKKSPAYKMKGFSGFGNSPAKQGISTLETDEERKVRVRKEEMENKPRQGISTLETEKDRLDRVRREKEEAQPGTGVKKTPKNQFPKKKSPAKVSDSDILKLQHKLNKAELDFKEPGWAKVAGKLHDPLGIMGGGGKGGGKGGDTASKVSKTASDAKGTADALTSIGEKFSESETKALATQ